MKYNTDITQLALSLMPSSLRRPVAQRLVAALVAPLHHAMQALKEVDADFANTVALNSSSVRLEDMLNGLFCFDDRQIYLAYRSVAKDKQVCFWAFKEETLVRRNTYFAEEAPEDERIYYYTFVNEYPEEESITVMVPMFLVSAVDTTDPTEQSHLRLIRSTIERNKPTGRIYTIKIYDYE